jgi:myo-inositol-1-phosphate synthase
MVMIWCGSTEVFHRPGAVHQSLRDFECGLLKNDPEIAPSQIYAYAALKSGVPYANGAPNLTTDTPALLELARERQIPVCGKDFKTGQTLMKTLIAPGLKARMLGMNGWFSTNILGNRDGEVLEDPGWDNIDNSAGSATRCKSKSISFAGIRFSPRHWCSIWCCSSI